MPHSSKGFTLLEATIVIVILSILSVGVYFKWPGNVMNLNAQAGLLAQDLNYAKSLAMTSGQRYRLIRTSANSYQIQNASGIAVRASAGNTTVTLNDRIVFGTFTNLPNNLINFDGRGIPYTDTASPGTALTATAVWTLTAGGESASVSVTPETGNVHLTY